MRTCFETFAQARTEQPFLALPSHVALDGHPAEIFEAGAGVPQLLLREVAPESASAYFDALSASALTAVTRSSLANVLFGAFRDPASETVYYVTHHTGALRISAVQEKNAFLPDYLDRPSFERLCDTKGYLVGVSDSGAPHHFENGMCLFYQLADGRFLVFDGGQGGDDDAAHLYELLRESADKNGIGGIRIAALVVTHAHGDHMGFFRSFLQHYVADGRVSLDTVLLNRSTEDHGHAYTGMSRVENGMVDAISAYAKQIRLIPLHTGQRFYLADMLLEVLFTMEDFLPGEAYPGLPDDSNAASCVLRLTVDGESILMTGDAFPTSCDMMVEMYGDALHADAVQTPHHGVHNGATVAFYDAVSPRYALFTCGDRLYRDMAINKPYTKHLIEDLVDRENIYIAGCYHRSEATGRITEIGFSPMALRVTQTPHLPKP